MANLKIPLITASILLMSLDIAVAGKCTEIDDASLWLPKDKLSHMDAFRSKAKRLNDSGQCVIEGGFGRSYNKFYITVSKTGLLRNAKILRFTRSELDL